MNTDLIIAIVFFIIGLIPAYYFYQKSIRIREPVYSITSNNLISDSTSKYQNLKISYNRRKVENLTASKVLFYNRGAETITQEDIITKNRPRIIPKEGVRILDASILQMNNPSSDFGIPSALFQESNEVVIWFKYIDKNQGAVYQIIHTGLSSKDIDVAGDIRGVSKIARITQRPRAAYQFLMKARKRVVGIFAITFMTVLSFVFFWANMFYVFYPKEAEQFRNSLQPSSDARIFLILSSLLLILFTLFSIDLFRGIYGGNKIAPKGLEKFDEK